MPGPFLFKSFFKKVIAKEMKKGVFEAMTKSITSAPPGSRAWPQKSWDTKLGLRIDYGELFTDSNGIRRRNFVLQPNKNAENEVLKKLAEEDSHQQLMIISVPVSPEHREGMSSETLVEDFSDGLF